MIFKKISSSFVAPNVEAVVFVETDVPSSYSLLEAEWVMHLSGLDKRIQVGAILILKEFLFNTKFPMPIQGIGINGIGIKGENIQIN